jgi:hypothetical protein
MYCFFSLKPFIQILPSDSKKACGNLTLRPLLELPQNTYREDPAGYMGLPIIPPHYDFALYESIVKYINDTCTM